jgi:hypothetical protein
MVGIVTRITRMEYTVTYKLRDTKSGALVDVKQTDLRMGANVGLEPRGAVADREPPAGTGEIMGTLRTSKETPWKS